VAHFNASLPIQDDIGDVTVWSGDANIEKCLRSEIGARNIDRIRRPSNSIRPVELQLSDDWSGYQQRWSIEFGATDGIYRVGHATSDQDSAVHEQGGRVMLARRGHFSYGGECIGGRIKEFGADGIRGKYHHTVTYNIERLVTALDELLRREEHSLYPFVGAWNPVLPKCRTRLL
jgi:hypothetical protein